MPTQLGELLRRTRQTLGLSPQGLARRLGYANVNKGARRIGGFEKTGQDAPEFVAQVARELGVENTMVADLRSRDEAQRAAEFEAWLAVPQPMALLSMVAGLAFDLPLPDGLNEQEAVAFAVERHREHPRRRLCLVVDRRRSLWLNPGSEPFWTETTRDSPNVPYTTVG